MRLSRKSPPMDTNAIRHIMRSYCVPSAKRSGQIGRDEMSWFDVINIMCRNTYYRYIIVLYT